MSRYIKTALIVVISLVASFEVFYRLTVKYFMRHFVFAKESNFTIISEDAEEIQVNISFTPKGILIGLINTPFILRKYAAPGARIAIDGKVIARYIGTTRKEAIFFVY